MATCNDIQRQYNELLVRLDRANPDTIEYQEILNDLSTNCTLQVTQDCVQLASLPTGAWQMNANGSAGQLDISFYAVFVGGEGCVPRVTGDVVIDAGRADPIDGTWDEANQKVIFTRSGIPGNITQTFTGFLSLPALPAQLTTLTGAYIQSDNPDQTYPWSAVLP